MSPSHGDTKSRAMHRSRGNVIRYSVFVLGIFIFAAGCDDGPPPAPDACSIEYNLPADVAGPLSAATNSDFHRDSWQTFLALAAPEVGASVASSGDNPTQWSKWSSSVEMIKCNLDNQNCDCVDGDCRNPGSRYYPPECRSVPGYESMRVLSAIDKFDDSVLQAKRKGLSDAPLIDANGKFVRYEILLSPPAYSYLAENDYYSWPELYSLEPPQNLNFPCGVESYRGGDPAQDESGAFVLKIAWMEDGLPGQSYHKENLLVYTPANRTRDGELATCERQTLAMVGMHVAHKTVKQPNWTWATWEHRRNAPDCAGLPPAGAQQPVLNTNCPESVEADYNFARADCSGEICQSCNISPESNAPPGGCYDSYLEDQRGWCPNQPPAAERGYSYLCRQVPIEANYPSAALWNDRCTAALGEASVWSQYELVATQWLTYDEEPTVCENVQASFITKCGEKNPDCAGPKLDSRERTFPQVDIPATNDPEGLNVQRRPWLGNTSMESYERSNCSGCHGIGLATANQDPIRVSTDFMYFVQFETCAAWCAELGDETCECMLPK